MVYELAIKNGSIIDGTGNPWYKADIGIKDGKIDNISRIQLEDANKIIDASGLIICPGFINLHSHSDSTILFHNKAENALAMGLVTEVTGNCGSSVAPLNDKLRGRVKQRLLNRGISEEIDWTTLDEWLKRLENKGIGINIVPLVGHGTVRSIVMGTETEGGEKIIPNNTEMNEMKYIIDKTMKEGAFGLSSGLIYNPGRNALKDELIELCKVVGKYGGVYQSHIRDEADKVLEAVYEFIEICEKSKVRGVISHHKVMFRNNFGKSCETLRLINMARTRGIDIIIDQYPWRHGRGNKTLAHAIGFKSFVKSRTELLERLNNEKEWNKLKTLVTDQWNTEMSLYQNRKKMLEEKGSYTQNPYYKENIYILWSKSHPEFEHLFLEEIVRELKVEDIWEAARVLLLDDEGYTVAHMEPFNEEDMIRILKYPWTTVSTDSYAWDDSKISFQVMTEKLATPHPRGYGTYAKILGKFVRDEKILTIEEAIRKMTSLPANFLGLQDRGIVKEGFWADLVIFDPTKVKNRADYQNPTVSPEGIIYVLVNGMISIDKGIRNNILSGKPLRSTAK